jgi:putative endonuclease
VDGSRQELRRRMARAYLRRFPRERREAVRVRLDAVSVYLQPDGTDQRGIEFDVQKGAFEWD